MANSSSDVEAAAAAAGGKGKIYAVEHLEEGVPVRCALLQRQTSGCPGMAWLCVFIMAALTASS